jgi:predicted small secreted protein
MKCVLVIFLLLAAALMNGCETTKGLAVGTAYGVGSVAQGVGKDTYGAFKFITAADDWIRKNLW